MPPRNITAMTMLALLGLAGIAFAHEGATGVVKERMDLMKDQQQTMKLIGDMAKGKRPFDAAKAAAAAHDLSATTKQIPELFPKGSNGHPSEALDSIWEDWDRFVAGARKAEDAANALAGTLEANPPGDWKAAFKATIDACKACHEGFRAEEEETGHRH